MKTRLFATLTALTLSAYAGTAAHAEDAGVKLDWQQPGYVMDVVVVTAKRPASVATDTATDPAIGTDAVAEDTDAAATGDVALAWQEPGYVMDVVVVKASRTEWLAEVREAAHQAALQRRALFDRGAAWNAFGTPAR